MVPRTEQIEGGIDQGPGSTKASKEMGAVYDINKS